MLGLDGAVRIATLSAICQHTTVEDSKTSDNEIHPSHTYFFKSILTFFREETG